MVNVENVEKNPPAYALIAEKLDRQGGQHLYRQIADLMREQIRTGTLAAGESIPTQRELSAQWRIGEVTIRRAMQELAEEGLIEARAGGGTVVRSPHQNHRPNARRPLSLGVACADLTDGYPFFTPLLKGLRSGPETIYARLFDMPITEQATGSLQHVPPLADFDGIIMMSPINLALAATCQQQQIPSVMLFSDLSDGYTQCIVPDYHRGMSQAVRHLVEQGRKRIAMVTAGLERFSTGRWLEAHANALESHDLRRDPSLVINAGYDERDGYTAMKTLLAHSEPPDAVVFASDPMARGGLLAAHEASVDVPKQLAVIGAGRTLGANGWTVPLTTIDLGIETMGQLARQAIEICLRGDKPQAFRRSVPSTLVEGGTG